MELVLPQAGKMTHALKKLHIVERCFRTIKGDILFREREYPLWNPKRKAFDWQSLA
jgi:hypothetical protein